MVSIVNPSESFSVDVSINLSGSNLRMSKHRLNSPEVRVPLQQMGRKRMAKYVRAYLAGLYPRRSRVTFYTLPKSLPGHG